MKVYIKMIQGTERLIEVDSSIRGSELKEKIAQDLSVDAQVQRLIYKGKPISDEALISSVGISDNSRIHLMIKKENKSIAVKEQNDFYSQLNAFLLNHLSSEQTVRVISDFKKNFQVLIGNMNFDDIEKFAGSNFTQF